MQNGTFDPYKGMDNLNFEDYVLTKEGSKNFGEITIEIANKIRRQTGKIRLRIGLHQGKKNDFGMLHIERTERLKQLKENNFNNACELVQYVAGSFDVIYKGNGLRLILSKRGIKNDISIFIELISFNNEEFYDVKTGFISRKNYLKNKIPLWEKPQSGI